MVRLLGGGGYRRYEFKAADKLLGVSNTLLQDYAGDLNVLHCLAADGPDLERQIKRLGKGVGDVTVNIFLHEMRTIWPKAQPLASKTNGSGRQSIGLIANDLGDGRAVLEALKAAEKEDGRKPEDFPAFEAAPVRYGLATRKRAYVPCTAACFRLSLISTKGKLSGFLWMPHNKKNWQFARSMRAGRRAAVVMSLLHSARLNQPRRTRLHEGCAGALTDATG